MDLSFSFFRFVPVNRVHPGLPFKQFVRQGQSNHQVQIVLCLVLLFASSSLFAQGLFPSRTDFNTGSGPFSVSIGDLNGDGKPDLAVANNDGNIISIFLSTTDSGASTPSFAVRTDFVSGPSPRSVSIGDLNADGKPDLAVANLGDHTASIFLNTADPGASTASYSAKFDFGVGNAPASVSVGDLNGDGKPDIATANNVDNTVSILLNITDPGASTPSYSAKSDFVVGTGPTAVCIGDLNGDGKPDLVTANNGDTTVSILLNTTGPGASTPTFSAKTDFTTGGGPFSVSIGDLNEDGKPDLAVANNNTYTVSVLLNVTDAGAATPSFSVKTDFTTGLSPRSVSIGDLDGDGKPDLAVANLGEQTVSVLLNTTDPGAATPSFSDKTDYITGNGQRSVSIGDLNNDDKLDLAVVNYFDNTVSVFINGAPAPLPVELVSFTATTDGSSVDLQWQTATEMNNYGFAVERKTIGSGKLGIENWKHAGFVEGAGTVYSPRTYSFIDRNPAAAESALPGSGFSYRLKQIDRDGAYQYSETIEIVIGSSTMKFGLGQNYPNPFNPTTEIRYQMSEAGRVTLKVYDVVGREVAALVNETVEAGEHTVQFNATNLSSGMYFYTLRTGNVVESKRMMLVK